MLKWIICLQKKNHIWINYKLKGHRCWKNAFSSSISSLIFLLAYIYLLSHSSLPCVINMCVWKAENNYILSASTWQWQALWATDRPLSQGEGILWAFDWPLPEEILCISDWLGSVIFHLSGPRTHTVIVWLWQEPPLYSKCVNVSFLLLLNDILWALMGSCGAGTEVEHSVARRTTSHVAVCQVTSRQEVYSTESKSSTAITQKHISYHIGVFYVQMCT